MCDNNPLRIGSSARRERADRACWAAVQPWQPTHSIVRCTSTASPAHDAATPLSQVSTDTRRPAPPPSPIKPICCAAVAALGTAHISIICPWILPMKSTQGVRLHGSFFVILCRRIGDQVPPQEQSELRGRSAAQPGPPARRRSTTSDDSVEVGFVQKTFIYIGTPTARGAGASGDPIIVYAQVQTSQHA